MSPGSCTAWSPARGSRHWQSVQAVRSQPRPLHWSQGAAQDAAQWVAAHLGTADDRCSVPHRLHHVHACTGVNCGGLGGCRTWSS